MKTKVILADDHQFLLEGIRSVLKDVESIEIIATVQNGVALMEEVSRNHPGLVVLDLNMPGLDGIQCLKKIKASYPSTRVMILSNYNQPELVEEVKRLNADGYLVKNSSATELKEAIQEILAGKLYFPSHQELQPAPDNYFLDEFLKKYQLTKREVDIIRLVCQEKSTKQIAGDLYLSELTVNTHRRNIFRKLDVKNVAGLMNFARENLLV